MPEIGAKLVGEEFEENTLYGGPTLKLGRNVLRLRRIGKSASLTYKERHHTSSSIKHQREEETQVKDPDAMHEILVALGFSPALVYEKRRTTWRLRKTDIVVDELPFGLYMEIEGSEHDIMTIERKLAIEHLRAEEATYPELTRAHGKKTGKMVESRFSR